MVCWHVEILQKIKNLSLFKETNLRRHRKAEKQQICKELISASRIMEQLWEEALNKNIVETDGLNEKLIKSHKPSGNDYKEKANFLMGQLQKAARSGDL